MGKIAVERERQADGACQWIEQQQHAAAGEQEPARHCLLCSDTDECRGISTGRGDGLRRGR